jgi:membrane protease subunit (stomatin/prohibitin family)
MNKSDDLIKRQDAIDAADRSDYLGLAVEDVKKVTDEVVKELKRLPSAQPERKNGKWIDDECSEFYYANCSECGYQIDVHAERGYFNFCPNCGCDMRGKQDE